MKYLASKETGRTFEYICEYMKYRGIGYIGIWGEEFNVKGRKGLKTYNCLSGRESKTDIRLLDFLSKT